MKQAFLRTGWCRFACDARLAAWVAHARAAADAAVVAPENAHWLRCGGTWFAGVNVLPNDAAGVVAGGPPLGGVAIDFIRDHLGLPGLAWDRAQVSVVYPGYPRPSASESAAAHRYRRDRDGAHIDGLLPVGPQRRRHLREHHAFVLGIPMAPADDTGAPFVVWEGSHRLARAAFRAHLAGTDPGAWRDIDLTETYHALRRRVFDTCRRTEVCARAGEAYLVHRLALHGMAPWEAAAPPVAQGRTVVYFRPALAGPVCWLDTS